MLSKEISDKVLTIGCAYKSPKGGVAQVLYSYATCIFNPFHFVATTIKGGKLKKLLWLLIAIPLFILRCLSSKIKIVHIHGASYNSFYRKRIFINIAKGLEKKVVYHIHGGGFADFYRSNKTDVDKVMKKVDAVVALSDSWKTFFENEVGCRRVVVIPNIVPYHPSCDKKSSVPIQCVFLGTINENKGVYDMIDVIRKHQDEFRGNLILHIGGSGEQDKMLALINRYGVADIIIYDGFVSGNKKEYLLNSSDFFILPSYVEGLPISILEAMSYSLPILTTPVGGIPEVVENRVNGLLVHPGDKEAIYHALWELMSDAGLRKRMGETSYRKVQPHFPDNVSRSLETLYTELL